jgi:hypothetical protein
VEWKLQTKLPSSTAIYRFYRLQPLVAAFGHIYPLLSLLRSIIVLSHYRTIVLSLLPSYRQGGLDPPR